MVRKYTNIGGSEYNGHTFALMANIQASRDVNKIWTIHYIGKISTSSGTTSDNFNFGIRIAHLKNARGITSGITYIGGYYTTWNSSGTLASYDQMEYATGYEVNSYFFGFSRYHTITGDLGGWAADSSIVAVNNLIEGIIILQESK